MSQADNSHTTIAPKTAAASAVSRRRALAIVAAVPAAAALGGATVTLGEPGELAALVRRYFEEVDYFNATSLEANRSDEESNALAEATFDRTTREIVGVPARSREDALAALDWLTKEGVDLDEVNYCERDEWSPHCTTAMSLIDAIRGYIEGRVA